MKLTKIDTAILNSYISLLDWLSDYLGSGYELVLHSLEDLDQSVVKIINGHYSNRVEGAPITDLALTMLHNIRTSNNHHQQAIYFNRNKAGTPMKSVTIPITGEKDRIIGLLCINFYMDIPLYSYIKELYDISSLEDTQNVTVENFPGKKDDLIATSLEKAKNEIYSNPAIQSINRNKEILHILYQSGIFNLKDAVPRVASSLGLSKNTVYLHIRNFGKAGEV